MLALTASIGAYAQKCNSQTPDDAPASRYQVNADGTAMDLQTGLAWMRCDMGQKWDAKSGQCGGDVKQYGWQQALQAVQKFDQGGGFAGHADWRLPNLRELESIERFHCSNPYINLKVFPAAPGTVTWSATPLEGSYAFAWALDFGEGHATYNGMAGTYAIRLVRAGAFDNKIPPPATAPNPVSSSPGAVINY
jgi:hypothetical protein